MPEHDAPPGGWPTPQAAYIHVPFCRRRCGYCNFSVVAGRDDLIERYLSAIDGELAELGRPAITTLFIGGGTPTQLSPTRLNQLLRCLKTRFQWESDLEFTIEANPEDINDQILDLLVEHDVNRISLGIQSFNDRKLKMLERGHRGQQAREVINLAAAKIQNVSLDLIFAAPGESLHDWQQDVADALALPINHLSTYALTFEKGTSYWSRRQHGQLRSADESVEVEMYEHVREACRNAGLVHYEISNFAKPGFQCRHNLTYWQGRGWYAAGPGAGRFVDGVREVNHRSTTTYLNRIAQGLNPVAEREPISRIEHAREKAAFGIRMIGGIDLDQLFVETGVDLTQLCNEALASCYASGLLTGTTSRIRLTDRGVLFADAVAADLLG